jgi:hypothetical protein
VEVKQQYQVKIKNRSAALKTWMMMMMMMMTSGRLGKVLENKDFSHREPRIL